MLNLFDVKCFLILAQTLNFTKTAEMLYLSQQAVSQRVTKMEQEFGFPLFIRTRSFVRLTSAGQRWYQLLQPAADQCRALLEECCREYSELKKQLRIGYQNMLDLNAIYTKVQGDLMRETPNLNIVSELFDAAVLMSKLQLGAVDTIVVYDRFAAKTAGLERLELIQIPLVLLVSARDRGISPEATYLDFAHYPLIEDVFGSNSAEQTIARAKKTAARCHLAPSDYIVVSNRDSANIAAESGRGVIVGTELSVAYRSPWLKAFPLPADETLVCLWRSDEENPLVKRFAKQLQCALQSAYSGKQ